MQRFTKKFPGHDCIRNPCGRRGCGTRPGANHGIASEQWFYAVSNGQVALSLRVSSDVYPDTVPAHSVSADQPYGTVMHEHRAFPTSAADVLGEPDECEYLDDGVCYGDDGSGLAARDFYQEHGGPVFEQPDSFWLAFEQELEKRAARLQAERVDGKIERCRCCGGKGTVEVSQ